MILRVNWVDAAHIEGWTDDIEVEACECESVGFLVRETEKEIVLATSINHSEDAKNKYGQLQIIPVSAIRERVEL